MIKLFTICFILMGFSSFSQSSDELEKQRIIATVNKFFLALEKKDTLLYNSIALPGCQIWTVQRINDTVKTTMRNIRTDMDRLVKMNTVIEERPLNFTIHIRNDIAMAWVPYSLSLSGKFSHCGIDIFTLLKTNLGWKITDIAYSVEKEGCDTAKW